MLENFKTLLSLGHMGLFVNKVALEEVFYKHFGFPCQFSLHQLLHIH
jgi:hypothetical protein